MIENKYPRDVLNIVYAPYGDDDGRRIVRIDCANVVSNDVIIVRVSSVDRVSDDKKKKKKLQQQQQNRTRCP